MRQSIWANITQRLSGEETPESSKVLDDWLSADPAHRKQFFEAKALWDLTALIIPEQTDDILRLPEVKAAPEPVVRLKKWTVLKYGIAATLAGTLLFLALFYFNKNEVSADEWVIHTAKPGSILAIDLPDRSKVWLNSGTKIRFKKVSYQSKLREIELQGQAYFEVRHDEKHPFVVRSGELITTVYGTSFNITAYPGKENSVAVNSGKVGVIQVNAPDSTFFLLPSDKLTLRGDVLLKSEVDINDVKSWTQGELIFEQTALAEVFTALELRYQVKIQALQDYTPCRLTGRFKGQSLAEVLKTLNISMNIRSEQVGNIIYLKGGNCM